MKRQKKTSLLFTTAKRSLRKKGKHWCLPRVRSSKEMLNSWVRLLTRKNYTSIHVLSGEWKKHNFMWIVYLRAAQVCNYLLYGNNQVRKLDAKLLFPTRHCPSFSLMLWQMLHCGPRQSPYTIFPKQGINSRAAKYVSLSVQTEALEFIMYGHRKCTCEHDPDVMHISFWFFVISYRFQDFTSGEIQFCADMSPRARQILYKVTFTCKLENHSLSADFPTY